MNPGDTLSHYRVIALVGAGGMGEVYKAEDTRLKRPVALKVLTPALSDNPDAKQRLIVEAQAASALDHPNICTVHEIDETPDGRLFLAMAFYDGETLAKRITRGAVSLPEALDIIVQVTRAVATAHDAGIIHRDIKPANIYLCSRQGSRAADDTQLDTSSTGRYSGDTARVKLLDFGIAKLADQTGVTRTGSTVGTAPYMAPEHIAGHAIDARADIWSLGVVLYELVSGSRPFGGENALAIMRAITESQPRPLGAVRPEVPPALDAIVERALQKRPGDRYASVHQFLDDLESLRASIGTATATVPHATAVPRSRLGKPAMAMAAVAIIAIASVTAWYVSRSTRERQTQAVVEEIQAMVEQDQFVPALRRLWTLPPDIANNEAVEKLRQDFFMPLSIRTEPSDADVYLKGYDEPKADWLHLGRTPIATRGTNGAYRWRVVKAGYETFEGASGPSAVGDVTFTLVPNGTNPENTVPVPGGPISGGSRIPGFLIDRFEVTNKAFKQFVDAGGYRSPVHWKHLFVKDGRTLSWEQAMAEFRDTTGRPGPSTWELGNYPDGHEDWPVSGISWYEAAAYAQFAGRSLPTVHHWRLAAQMSIFSEILEWSNFSGKGPVRVGEYAGIGPMGTYDMAGNVKEWCANEVGDRRYIMGGAWNEPNYQYRSPDARLPFDRSANNGMRLVSIADSSAVPPAAYAPVPQLSRDYAKETPVTDEVFAAFRRLYSYDTSDLAASRRIDQRRVRRVAGRARVLQRGLRRRAYPRVSLSSEEQRATVSNGGLLSALGRNADRLLSAGRNGLPGVPCQVWPGAAVPDVPGHVRTPARQSRQADPTRYAILSSSRSRTSADRIDYLQTRPEHCPRQDRVLRREPRWQSRLRGSGRRATLQDGRVVVGWLAAGHLRSRSRSDQLCAACEDAADHVERTRRLHLPDRDFAGAAVSIARNACRRQRARAVRRRTCVSVLADD